MKYKFKFYKQVKTLYIEENEGIVDSFINADDFVFWTRKGTLWFTCEALNKKYKNHILLQLNGNKRLKNGEGNVLDEDMTFYNDDAFEVFEPNEKQLAKAEERFKYFLDQQFEEYKVDWETFRKCF